MSLARLTLKSCVNVQTRVCFASDCEHLIRRMLVLDPKKRYKTRQIAQHRWMTQHSDVTPASASLHKQQQAVVTSVVTPDAASPAASTRAQTPAFNEQILRLMKGLGIDQRKTVEVKTIFKT